MHPANRYAAIQNQTASRERLLVLLLEAAVRNIRDGAVALEQGRPLQASGPLAKAGDIVVELQATLDRSRAPELCDQLVEIYRFVSFRLLKANLERNPEYAREAERALAPVAEGFAEAVAKLGDSGGR